jgi:hypothetical protein
MSFWTDSKTVTELKDYHRLFKVWRDEHQRSIDQLDKEIAEIEIALQER